MLAEAPGKEEDKQGEPLVGESGQLLRPHIPRRFRDHVRINNVVRTRPIDNDTPDQVSIECCRPSIIKDIERTQPTAIFGFGNVPLEWVSGLSGITLWRGRKMPVKVGKHTCWYYPMLHPAYLIRQRRGDGDIGSEEERMFGFDMKKAFAEVENLPDAVVHTAAAARAGVEVVVETDAEALSRIQKFLYWAADQPCVGIDYETDGLRPYGDKRILTAAVSDGKRSLAFAFDHPEARWSNDHREQLNGAWCGFLRRAKGVKAVHNLSFEQEWTGYWFGKDLLRAGEWADTQAQAVILDERTGKLKGGGPLSLAFLVQQYFGFDLKGLSSVNRKNLAEEPLPVVLLYNGMDAKYHKLLWDKQEQRIWNEGLMHPYNLALRRVPAMVLSQLKGVPVDQKEVKRLSKKYGKQLETLEEEISKLDIVKEFTRRKGKKLNVKSFPDLLFVFKDILGLGKSIMIKDKFTQKYKYSLDESVLDKIDHPLASKIVALRSVLKNKSTYIDPMDAEGPVDKRVLYPDGMLHTNYNTMFAETGRISSDGPNLQNYPARDADAKEVRKPIAAAPDEWILKFDYGQIEARVIAMFTKDPTYVKALWEDYDIHGDWAERIATDYPARIGGRKNLTDKKVMKEFRGDIKNQFTFPLFFGARMESVAGYLQIPVEFVKPHYEAFWREFSTTSDWQQQQIKFYRQHGYVEGLTGRRRHGPLTINKVCNTPVQGTATEIVMDGLCRLSEKGIPELQPELMIHDDLTFLRVPDRDIDTIAEQIISEMLAVPFDFINVPITVEMEMGKNWMELERVGTYSSVSWGTKS